MIDLHGKAAVVTGGSSGVGRATVLELARHGCRVLVHYNRSRDEAEAVAAEVRALGVDCLTAQGDAALDVDCRRIVAAAAEKFGRLVATYDHPRGRLLVGLEDGTLLTVPAAIKKFGNDMLRWVTELTPESRRSSPSVGDFLSSHPEKAVR